MDHAGIATQMVVERQLMERQIHRRSIAREEFVARVWEWKDESGGMILNQLKIAPAIVTITYAAILGAIALGSAIAFGLGGREVAGRMLEGAYDIGREKKDDWKDDADRAMARSGIS